MTAGNLDYASQIQQVGEEIGYYVSVSKERNHISFEDDNSRNIINFELSQPGIAYAYIYSRTLSWDLPGERTDANEIISVLLSVLLRITNVASCRIWDIPHPVDVPDTEIYARYIVPDQPYKSAYELTPKGLEKIRTFSTVVRNFGIMLPKLFDWDVSKPHGPWAYDNYEYNGMEPWAVNIASIVGEKYDEEKIQFCQRTNPSWRHYRSTQTGLTIYQAPTIVRSLTTTLQAKQPWEQTLISTGNSYSAEGIVNFISRREAAFVERILKGLSRQRHLHDIVHIPLENVFVSAAGEYLIFLYRDCSRKRFEYEREKARKNHAQEAKSLYPDTDFIWSTAINGDRFEDFIIDLLRIEPGVIWVRQVSTTNEPDGGKDVLCDWITTPASAIHLNKESPPYEIRKVLVQCKGHKATVNKSMVSDIRDRVERHRANGFFLAVSSHLTTELTDYLYDLRTAGKIWADWWTRSEIEERLRQHRHLIEKYSDIVRFK